MSKRETKTSIVIVAILFITMLVVSGGTFAYFQWRTSSDQATILNVSVTDDINMHIDPPSITKAGMRPTNNCAGDFAMSGVSTVTIDNNTGTLARPRLKLKLKITDKDGNNITNVTSPAGQKYMYYIKYAVTGENGNCTRPLIDGRFNETTETSTGSGWYDSPSLTVDDANGFPNLYTGVSFNVKANAVTSHKYKVIVWIDEIYTTVNTGDTVTNDKLQDATITVSWSENSSVEQVDSEFIMPPGEAYAVYSADDTSLRFYRSETPITSGSTYNGLTATAVYKDFEDVSYSSNSDVPWSSYDETITNVVFEDVIVPESTAYWFYDFEKCINFYVGNLNTLKVTDMSWMFYSAGKGATIFSLNLSGWDVSNVINMSNMFDSAGYEVTTFLLDLSNWDTSSVVDMSNMFSSAGQDATTFNIIGLENWSTSNVTDMSYMFFNIGTLADWSLDLSEWDVEKVENCTTFLINGTDDRMIMPPFTCDSSGWV